MPASGSSLFQPCQTALKNPAIHAVSGNFNKAYVVTLTPSARHKSTADAHLSWAQIHGLIEDQLNVNRDPTEFRAFGLLLPTLIALSGATRVGSLKSAQRELDEHS
jgi:hypothetical protein